VLTKKVLILGGSGQDGAFLAEKYMQIGLKVFSVSRNESTRLNNLGVKQYRRDLSSDIGILDILLDICPDIVVNLASISSVAFCEMNPELSQIINFEAVKSMMKQIIIFTEIQGKHIKFIQASSSEMFGNTSEICDESTPMNPLTVYGKHKFQSHEFLLNQAKAQIDCKSVVLFNHESEFRTSEFVSSKASKAAVEVFKHGNTQIQFGNLNNQRDWGFAGDYMDALAKISTSGSKNCYVIASGKLHSIEEMLTLAFSCVGVSNYRDYISISEKYYRKIETPPIKGNAQVCTAELNWKPTLSFEQLIERLVKHQIENISKD
jgi:GDPmannose 4,6-dehydratase